MNKILQKIKSKRKSITAQQSKLRVLRSALRANEAYESDYLSKEVKELRHWILFTQAEVELNLELIIVGDLGTFDQRADEREYDRRTMFLVKTRYVFDRLDFKRKLDISKDLGIINKEVYTKIDNLRKLRNIFAHGLNSELNSYGNHDKMLDAYEIVVNAYYVLRPLLAKYKLNKDKK